MPLFVAFSTFHSTDSSKSPNSSTVTRSPLLAVRTMQPSMTFHPAPGSGSERLRQPESEWPSNRRRHPPDCSESDRVLASDARAEGAQSRRADRKRLWQTRDLFM